MYSQNPIVLPNRESVDSFEMHRKNYFLYDYILKYFFRFKYRYCMDFYFSMYSFSSILQHILFFIDSYCILF